MYSGNEAVCLSASFVIETPLRIWSNAALAIEAGVVCGLWNNDDPCLREWSDSHNARCIEMPGSILLPGLINSHTHLEFSSLAQPIRHQGSFASWVGSVIAHRRSSQAGRDSQLIAQAARQAWLSGLKECSEAGTALVIDIVNQPWMCDWSDGEATSVEQPEKQQAAVIALAEVLGLDQDRLGQTLAHAQRIQGGFLVSYRPSCRRLELMEVGLSPHAPYSLQHPSGMEQVDQLVRQHRSARPDLVSPVIAMHLAESTDELRWLERAEGPMAELFSRAGLPLDQPRMQVDEAIQSLAKWGRGLVIHGNYLSERQLDRVAECGLAMVYCPRTHRFFGHRRYPIEAILDRGIPLLLGTDSRASNPDLSVWRECLAARQTNPALSAAKALQSVTTAAADYLGLSDRLGSLQTGRRAWVNTLPVPSSATNENLLDLILPSESGEYSAAQPQPVIWSSR